MSKKTSTWMPLYVADYLADTTRLTTEQHGAYLLLIMDYWRNGPLPDDDGALANITRLTEAQWKKHRASIARLFQVDAGEWRHKRIDNELARASANVEQRSAAGKASAQKRKAQRKSDEKQNEQGNGNSTDVATSVETDDVNPSQQNVKPSPSPTSTHTTSPSGDSVCVPHARNPDGPTGILLPDDFQPCRQAAAKANSLGLDMQHELERFAAHYQSRSETRLDLRAWQAQFRKWLLDQQQFNADREKVTTAKVQAATRASTTRQDATAAACDTLGVGSQYLTGGTRHAQIAD